MLGVRHRRPWPLVDRCQAHPGHQSPDALAADNVALPPQMLRHLPRAVPQRLQDLRVRGRCGGSMRSSSSSRRTATCQTVPAKCRSTSAEATNWRRHGCRWQRRPAPRSSTGRGATGKRNASAAYCRPSGSPLSASPRARHTVANAPRRRGHSGPSTPPRHSALPYQSVRCRSTVLGKWGSNQAKCRPR